MAKLPTLKDPTREAKVFQRRVLVVIVGIAALSLLIVARLAYLQVLQHQHFTTLARDNRLKLVAIPPPRGLIYSRDGVILAENRPSYVLEMVADDVSDIDTALQDVANLLGLSSEAIEEVNSQIRVRRGFDPVIVAEGLSEQEVALFSVNQHRFDGFRIAAKLSRFYPEGAAMAHLVGYVGRINEEEEQQIDTRNYRGTHHMGKTGVEKAREETLHGAVGFQRVEVNAQGRIIRVVEQSPPTPGSNLYLTVDASLQQAGIAALGDNTGAIVAIDPNNGDVLAFVSKPAFDPNLFVDGISSKDYSALRDDKSRPLFNRALQAQYPPGSTIKPLVGLAGLSTGLRQPSDSIWCPGYFKLPGAAHRYRDWKKQGHGHIDLENSLAQSCDVYYYSLAKDLTIDGIYDMLSRFGLGQATGIDLPGETAGLLPSADWKKRTRSMPWFPGETLITGIGQGFMLASPLQLANATATIAARGSRFIPHVVGQVEDAQSLIADSTGVYERPGVTVVNQAHWQAIIDGMVSVVHGARGTARRAGSGTSYRFAGKTGTAQLFGIAQGETVKNEDLPKHLRDHALFVAFAPIDEPLIAVAIIVENGSSGSRAAAPIARLLFDHYLAEPAAVASDG